MTYVGSGVLVVGLKDIHNLLESHWGLVEAKVENHILPIGTWQC